MDIVGWIALGIVLLALVLLAWVLLSLLRRLGPLKVAADGLRSRAAEAQSLQEQLEDLQPKVLELNLRVERVKDKLPHR